MNTIARIFVNQGTRIYQIDMDKIVGISAHPNQGDWHDQIWVTVYFDGMAQKLVIAKFDDWLGGEAAKLMEDVWEHKHLGQDMYIGEWENGTGRPILKGIEYEG